MRAAFATWDQRLAPVFDVARWIHVVDAEAGSVVAVNDEVLPSGMTVQRAVRLVELGVETVVCGAISRPAQDMLEAYHIGVVPFVTGELLDVVQAWLEGRLDDECFVMPGTGVSSRGGRGGRGRRGGSRTAGPRGRCVCAQCGHEEEHERRVPCRQKPCPRCGNLMTRT